MSAVRYTEYHPKWYRRRVSVWWWLKKPSYARFVLREISSVFVALGALLVLWQVHALARGPQAWARLTERLSTPIFLGLHALALFFILFHTLTWFHLAPKAMVVRLGDRRVPDAAIVAANYLAWLFASGFVAFMLLRG